MSTQDPFEELERKIREQGREQGREQAAKGALLMIYEARFGPMPRALADAVEAMHDAATLKRWVLLVGTRSQEEVDAAVQAEQTPATS